MTLAFRRSRKRQLFAKRLDQGTAVVSKQVLLEYFVSAVQKLKLPAEDAQRKVGLIAKSQVVRICADDAISPIEFTAFTESHFGML